MTRTEGDAPLVVPIADRSFRERALGVLAFAFGGLHHVDMSRVKWPSNTMCAYSVSQELSTYDGSLLTLLVVGAHDACVRLSVSPSGPGRVKIEMWPRVRESESTYKRHPHLEEHLARLRQAFGHWFDVDPFYLKERP